MKKGFTLIELLVVIAIIAVLATMAVTFVRKVKGGGDNPPENSQLPDVEYEIPTHE